MSDAIPHSEEQTLRRRARRRLVGAIALAMLAILVLPMVFDPEPKPFNEHVEINLPAPDSPFTATGQTAQDTGHEAGVAGAANPDVTAKAPDPARVDANPWPSTPAVSAETAPAARVSTPPPLESAPPPAHLPPLPVPVKPAPTVVNKPAVPAANVATTPPRSEASRRAEAEERKPVERKPVERKPPEQAVAKPATKPATQVKTPPKPPAQATAKPADKTKADTASTKTEDKATAAAKAAKAEQGSGQFNSTGYYLQLGAFSSEVNAQQLADRVRNAGMRASVVNTAGQSKVRMGPYAERSDALAMQKKLKAKGLSSVLLGP